MTENGADIPFLDVGSSTISNGDKSTTRSKQPPDGGFWASVVMQIRIQNKVIFFRLG